ncbi:hypothetical protein BX600DRAFT_511080 [Xylariales sp. PMI_506]|nr:hypothetical protein BX600DRAFT_511080 [Xylariales sp. PMI_506]
MPPPRGTFNPLEGPADYDMTSIVHSDTYPEIQPSQDSHRGKAVFISGASRGIGLAMALSFARAGASCIAIGARSDLSSVAQAVQDTAVAVGRSTPQVLALQFDVTDHESVSRAAEEVRREFGRLDIVINNAGIVTTGLLADSDPEEWHKVWHVNVFGPYHVMRAFIPLLLDSDGDKTIINVSSVGAHIVVPSFSAYETSKLAVLRLTEFASVEYGDQGLLAYCIHPGNIPTDLVGGIEGVDPEMRPVFVDTPELTADSLVYLTREKRDWLARRYINVTWDLPELMAKKDEIILQDKLKVKLVV